MSIKDLSDLDFDSSWATVSYHSAISYRRTCLLCNKPFETELEADLVCKDCKEDFMQWKQECETKREIERMVTPPILA